jgi:hypothetical protein
MKYFIIKNNIQQGPFTLEELRLHNISSDTLVWTEGMAQWTPAWQVNELKHLLYDHVTGSTETIPTPPPPPVNPDYKPKNAPLDARPESPQEAFAFTKAPAHERGTKAWPWLIIILVALLVFAAVTNPTKDQHRLVIKQKVTQGLTQSISPDENSLFYQGISIVARWLAGPLVNETLNNMLQYNNYVFFSTTSIATENDNITTSYGFFGQVFTISEEKISRYIRSAIDKDDTNSDVLNRDTDTTDNNDAFVQSSKNDTPGKDADAFIDDIINFIKDI